MTGAPGGAASAQKMAACALSLGDSGRVVSCHWHSDMMMRIHGPARRLVRSDSDIRRGSSLRVLCVAARLGVGAGRMRTATATQWHLGRMRRPHGTHDSEGEVLGSLLRLPPALAGVLPRDCIQIPT